MTATSRAETVKLVPRTEAGTTILLVDDDAAVLRMTQRRLERRGYRVVACSSGHEALAQLETHSFDAMVSDVRMPGMNGMELLRAVRQHDLDLPVLLTTGDPALDSATAAVAYGAFQYLSKPVAAGELEAAVEKAAALGQLARLKRQCLEEATSGIFRLGDRAGADATLDDALASLWMAFQPIVSTTNLEVFGHEALLRTGQEEITPLAVLQAAERAGRMVDLGRAVRAKTAQVIAAASSPSVFFVNLHPTDFLDPDLYSPEAPLSAYASQVVLELTERAALEGVAGMRERVRELRGLGYRIGLDDMGGGYSGLNTFVLLEPEFVKLDVSLIRDLHRDPAKRKVSSSIVSLCLEMDVTVIAKGVESQNEREALSQMGCDLVQGRLYAAPGASVLPETPTVRPPPP